MKSISSVVISNHDEILTRIKEVMFGKRHNKVGRQRLFKQSVILEGIS